MKKIILSVILSMAMIMPSMAQLTYRRGNTYTVGSEVMNKKAYEGFLKNTNPEAFRLFHNGRVLSNVGWGIFAGGAALDLVGVTIAYGSGNKAAQNIANGEDADVQKLTKQGYILYNLVSAGGALEIAGITMLGVGYYRMHNAADLYNIQQANKSTAYLTPASSGMGLALHF